MPPFQHKPVSWITLERNGPIALQAQIARWLESVIRSGQLGPGDILPTEARLVERLGVSRVTVRLAVDELVARGMVSRSHGRGSFVASPIVKHDLGSNVPFYDVHLAHAVRPELKVTCFQRGAPPAHVAKRFGLAADEAILAFDRAYLTSGRAAMVGRSWLAPDAAFLTQADVEAHSTAALHRDLLKRPIAKTTTTIGAENASAATAKILGVKPRSAVLVVTRCRLDSGGELREYNELSIDPASYELTVSSEGDIPVSAVPRVRAA
jgi:DNA-binding GntR family transcriptional regulator